MREIRDAINFISRSHCDQVRRVVTGRKERHQLIVNLKSTVSFVTSCRHKENSRRVQRINRIEQCLRKRAVSKTRIDNADVCSLSTSRGLPQIAHLFRIITGCDRVVNITSVSYLVQKLERHETNVPVNSRHSEVVVSGRADDSRNVARV